MDTNSGNRKILLFLAVALILFTANQGFGYLYRTFSGADFEKLCTWDCGWYRSIAGGGYDLKPHGHEKGDAASWAFFPLYPVLAGYLFSTKLFTVNTALILTSKFFFFTGIFSFILFADAWQSKDSSPWIAGAIAAFNPYSIYGNAGYSESLFLTLTCLSLYFLKKERYVLSGLFGGFLTATRIVGGSIGFAYLLRAARRWSRSGRRTEILLGLCLIPSGLAVYMLFLYFHVGDAMAFSNVQIAWNHAPGNPIAHALTAFNGNPISNAAGYGIIVAALALLTLLWFRHYELFVFSLIATLVPLSTGLISMPRYVWWQAPVLFAVAAWIERKRWTVWVYLAGSLVFSYFVYSAWFGGDTWVV